MTRPIIDESGEIAWPPGVQRFIVVSVLAAAAAGAVYTVRGIGWPGAQAWDATLLAVATLAHAAFVIAGTTALFSSVPIALAVVSGMLTRRLQSAIARAMVIVTSVALPISAPIVGVTSWATGEPNGAEAAILVGLPAVTLAVGAVAPWRGGFASGRFVAPRSMPVTK